MHMSYLSSLKQTILRFKENVEQFIEKKKEFIQGLLCDSKQSERGIVSSFYNAIQVDTSAGGLQIQKLADFTPMETIVYARYIKERMEKDSSTITNMFASQYGQGMDISLLGHVEPLIWMIIQIKMKLMMSCLRGNSIADELNFAYVNERVDPQLDM